MITTLFLKRTKASNDATFGELTYGEFKCFTLENRALQIAVGTYNAQLLPSPHFGCDTPHLSVPGRTDIEIHWANFPNQLRGCVAVGECIDGDALDNSKKAFDSLMAILPQQFDVAISEAF